MDFFSLSIWSFCECSIGQVRFEWLYIDKGSKDKTTGITLFL